MTPKEKAQELLSKYTSITLKEVVPGIFLAFDEELCKKFALISVDELIYFSSNQSLSVYFDGDYYCDHDFFVEVKKEIEAL